MNLSALLVEQIRATSHARRDLAHAEAEAERWRARFVGVEELRQDLRGERQAAAIALLRQLATARRAYRDLRHEHRQLADEVQRLRDALRRRAA